MIACPFCLCCSNWFTSSSRLQIRGISWEELNTPAIRSPRGFCKCEMTCLYARVWLRVEDWNQKRYNYAPKYIWIPFTSLMMDKIPFQHLNLIRLSATIQQNTLVWEYTAGLLNSTTSVWSVWGSPLQAADGKNVDDYGFRSVLMLPLFLQQVCFL